MVTGRAIRFPQSILDHRFTLRRVQLLFQAAQRDTDHVAMPQLRIMGRLIQLEPEIVDQLDILGPQLRWMWTQIEVGRFARDGVDYLERKGRPGLGKLLPGFAYAASLL